MCSCHCWFSLCLRHTYPPLHPALHVFMPLLVQSVSASHVPAVQPLRGRATAPVFTSDLHDQEFGCEHTGPLRHVTGFSGLGLLRVVRPIPPASAGNEPSRRPAGCWPVREPGGMVPTFTFQPFDRVGAQLCPLQHRHGYAAGPFTVASRSAISTDRQSSPHTTIDVCRCARCYAAPIRQVRAAGPS